MSQAAGKLNHWVDLVSLQTGQDSNGDPVEVWTTEASVWAEVAPSSAREFIASSAMQSRVVARIVIRQREVNPTWKVFFRGQYYNIEGVLPDPISGLEYITLPVSYYVEAVP